MFALNCIPASTPPASASTAGLAIGPGLSALTRILRSLRSVVHVRANDRTAAFVALYTLNASIPLMETIEALRMIDAPSGISGSAF